MSNELNLIPTTMNISTTNVATMKLRHGLNAKSIKKALKAYGVDVVYCYQGKGASAKAALIYVKTESVDAALYAFKSFGIVSTLGTPFVKYPCKAETYSFGLCYMSNEMHKELNA